MTKHQTSTLRLARIRLALSEFMRDSRGTMSVETALVFPLLFWAYGATFLFWDAFRAQNINLKAAYTIADALSRETSAVDQAYLDGLNEVYDYLTQSNHPVRLRVTTVKWDEDESRFDLIWSETSTTLWPKHDVDTLNAKAAQIPDMAVGDLAILVETQMAYEPFINVGIDPQIFENFIITRPRFGPQLAWRTADGTIVGADDDKDSVVDELDPDNPDGAGADT